MLTRADQPESPPAGVGGWEIVRITRVSVLVNEGKDAPTRICNLTHSNFSFRPTRNQRTISCSRCFLISFTLVKWVGSC